VHNGDTAIVTFTGVGYDRRVMGDTMPVTDQQDLTGVPGVQSVSVPGQVRKNSDLQMCSKSFEINR
jgi:propanediol utilization protein